MRFRVLAVDRMALELEISSNLESYDKMGSPLSSVLHRIFLSVWILFLKNEALGVTGRLFFATDATEEQQRCERARHFSVGCTGNTQHWYGWAPSKGKVFCF